MAGSSNQGFGTQQPPCPHFDGENYDFWCVKMKTQLISNDVWEYVEDGYDDLGNVDNLTNEQKQQLKEHKRKDARALSMIQQGVSDKIFPKIINETKAKGAWDILQNEYRRNFTDPSQHSDNPMHPNLYEAVKDGRVEDLNQYTDLFNTQFTSNPNPMDPSLYEAVKDGRVEHLDQYADVFDTQLTPNHNTILHVAAHFGKLECVTKILDKKPCLLRWVNVHCENPLYIAVRERHYGVVQALIERAREVDQEPESGAGTRLEILRAINVDGDTALHLAVREEDAQIVSLLVAEDPDFQHPPNKAEETPLYLATERRRGGSMVESILASNKLPACTGPNGRTALHAAAIFEDEDRMKKVLDRYEELIDKADTEGWTPLHYATNNWNEGIVRELLKRNKSIAYTRTSEKHDKSTTLHIAAASNNKWVMEDILAHCPDCWEMVNSKGRNILHIAVDAEAISVVEYILKKEGLESLMNKKDFEGNTPLHLLASSETMVAYFVTKKDGIINHCRAYDFNNQNKTPFDIASSVDVPRKKQDTSRWASLYRASTAPGWRNIAKGQVQENRKERERRIKERKEQDRAKRAEALKKTSESLTLVATLIATITFAAAFAIPGGYDGNQGLKQGMAVLVRQASFKAFAIANTIAVMCSTSSVVYYVFAAFHYSEEEKQGRRYEMGFYLVLIAIVAMTVGFISGTYAMLVRSLGLAIATSIIASITFLIYFLELRRLFELWYYLMFPWQDEIYVPEHSWPVKMLSKILGV